MYASFIASPYDSTQAGAECLSGNGSGTPPDCSDQSPSFAETPASTSRHHSPPSAPPSAPKKRKRQESSGLDRVANELTQFGEKMDLMSRMEDADNRERERERERERAAIDLGHLFRPFALEVFVCWGAESVNTLKEAASLAPAALDMSYSNFANYWRRQLAVCLQKGNADMIHNKVAAIIGQTPIDPNSINSIEARHYSIDFT